MDVERDWPNSAVGLPATTRTRHRPIDPRTRSDGATGGPLARNGASLTLQSDDVFSRCSFQRLWTQGDIMSSDIILYSNLALVVLRGALVVCQIVAHRTLQRRTEQDHCPSYGY